jgi:hypothetical protein
MPDVNSHFYELRARDVGWGVPDPDWGDGPLDASKVKLVDALEDVGVKRCATSTTSATAGSIQSRSSGSSTPNQVLSIRA